MEPDARDCWMRILNEIGPQGRNFATWGAHWSTDRPFTAREAGGYIVVEGPRITSPRTIYYREFECVFRYYEDYVNLEPGIRPRIRDECGVNSSYIITLIHEYC